MSECRAGIILTYAGWTALSALRSGSPIKSRDDLYPLIASIAFDQVLTGSSPITPAEFDDWHRAAIDNLAARDRRMNVGWAAKIVNVYLKTAAYVGDLGRPGIRDALHPPLDSGLWSGLRQAFPNNPAVRDVCLVARIKDINDYTTYSTMIAGCRRLAESVQCSPIEVEQFWLGARPSRRPEII